MVKVQKWAEIRAMALVEGKSIKEIVRRTGHSRNTVRRALRSDDPPSYARPPRPSKLDPYKPQIHELLKDERGISSQLIREEITKAGYLGGKTICDDYVRELRPIFDPPRTHQRTNYNPGELCQFDLWEPRAEIPVGYGQTRRGYVVTCASGYSRFAAGSLIFSKSAPDILWGMSRALAQIGALPEKLVWDREGAIHAGGGRPTDDFAAYCGALGVGWVILAAHDPQAKGLLERFHDFIERSFEPLRSFNGPLDYQAQFDGWLSERANPRIHRTLGERPVDRLAYEATQMRPLPQVMPDVAERFVIRVPAQPYLRYDTNDYSLDPRCAGRRVEVKAAQRQIVATALDTGEVVAQHRRCFAKQLTFTDQAHQAALDRLRGERRRGKAPEVERRALDRYDALIPA